jgi:hypothetical protein
VGRERRTGEIDGNGGVLCGNVRGILVIVEGESGRELQFGSFTGVGCFSQCKSRGADERAAERAGCLAFEAAKPLLKPLLKLCQTGSNSVSFHLHTCTYAPLAYNVIISHLFCCAAMQCMPVDPCIQ